MSISLPSRLTTLSLAITTALVAQVSQAASEASMPSMTAQTIVINASKSVKNTLQNDSVYSEDYVPAQQATHLSDFLEVVPGVNIGGTSTANQRIRIRGLDDTNLKVTIDGARQEGALFYHMGDITIDPDLIKQTEVAVGNNSVTLGNDALGGAVAFKTVDAVDLLQPGQKVGAKVGATYGSNNDEVLTSATVYGKPVDNVDLLAYYSKRDVESGEDGEGRELFEDSEADNILLKAGVDILNDQRLDASYSRTKREGIFPFRPDFPNRGNERIPQKIDRDTYTINYNFNPVDPLVNLGASIYQTETEISRDNDFEVSPGYDWRAKVKTTGGKVENISTMNHASGDHKIIAGLEHYKKESEMFRDGLVKGTDSAKNTSLYVEDQWKINKLTLTPGIRYDRYESPKYVADGKTYDNVSGALAASYEIAPRTYLFASYTQLFNGPDLSQAIFNSNGEKVYVNKDLKAEEGDNAEIGISTTFTNLTANDDSLQLNAKYFKTDIENYIQYIRTGDRPGRYGLNCTTGVQGSKGNLQSCQGVINNQQDYEIDGVELSANYNTRNFGMGLSYSRSRSEGSKDGKMIPSVTGSSADSGDRYMLNLNYAPNDSVDLGWRSTYVASLKNDDQSTKPSYDVHDAYMSYTPSQLKGLKATIGVYNLFDETYISHASRLNEKDISTSDYEPGRNVKASLTYQF